MLQSKGARFIQTDEKEKKRKEVEESVVFMSASNDCAGDCMKIPRRKATNPETRTHNLFTVSNNYCITVYL